MVDLRTFDRSDDVSKLDGCNTRNVAYRWDCFSRELANIPRGSETMDFGAGSLRDSFELTKRGYNVTSVDLGRDLLLSYQADYDWPTNGTTQKMVTGQNLSDCLSQIDHETFSLIICFDVLEHLEDPVSVLRQMRSYLKPEGRLFITVPNGRTLFEMWFRLILVTSRMLGKTLRPGEPHLQRNSPAQWKKILNEGGFEVLHQEMQIGFLVNTAFALVQIPLYIFGRLIRAAGMSVQTDKLQDIVCNRTAMRGLDRIDGKTKPYFTNLYGWCLFVATKS